MKCELTYTLEELGGNRPTVYTGRVRWELTYTLEERGGN